ncbi:MULTISPECIES: hypothetical protein [Bacillota]|nr:MULTISPECIES: hypothetical protein [Bacillota]
MHYALHELHYSPSELVEMYELPREFKAFMYGSISLHLEERAKEAGKNKQ